MATPRSAPVVPVVDVAAALLSHPETAARAQVIANRVCELVPDCATVIYVIEDRDNPAWVVKATAGEINLAQVVEFGAGTLGAVATTPPIQTFDCVSNMLLARPATVLPEFALHDLGSPAIRTTPQLVDCKIDPDTPPPKRSV